MKRTKEEIIEFTIGTNAGAPSLQELHEVLVENGIDYLHFRAGDSIKIDYVGSGGTEDPLNMVIEVRVTIQALRITS